VNQPYVAQLFVVEPPHGAARRGEAGRGWCDGDSTPALASLFSIAVLSGGFATSGTAVSASGRERGTPVLAELWHPCDMPRHPIVLLLCVAVLAGCGGSAGGGATPKLPEARQDLAGAPAVLAALHRQASEILPGGPAAVKARLHALRGHPVVVNQWGSWCGPCRSEFPILQRVSVKLGKRVAFLGVLLRDDKTSGAGRFLAQHPLSYPSYADHGEAIARALRNLTAAPITNFYDARGRLVYQHAGPYQSDAQLEADLKKYARGT